MTVALAIALVTFGLLFTIRPDFSWTLSNFWKFEDRAEPSNLSLALYRVQGILLVLAGLVVWAVWL
jgi:uncharacterized protein YjeT (DUF2065 family)